MKVLSFSSLKNQTQVHIFYIVDVQTVAPGVQKVTIARMGCQKRCA